MTGWDSLMNPAREALEALIAKGDDMADRIEELEAERDNWRKVAIDSLAMKEGSDTRAEAANAKLEKAMAYIDSVGQNPFLQISVRQYARATLAEIKGETT